jgi:hypothetical protein
VKVVGRDGQPQGGVPVTIAGPSSQTGSTSSDGCAVFAFLPAGNYTVTMTDAGYVNSKNEPAPSYSAGVQVGAITRLAVDYDRASTLQVTIEPPSGYTAPDPNQIGLTLGNSALVPSGRVSYTGTGSARTIGSLFPFAAGYEVWAGQCLDADPQFWGGQRDFLAAASPGQTTNITVPLLPVDVLVTRAGLPQSGQTILAKHMVAGAVGGDAGCPSGVTHVLGVTDSAGRLRASLPLGWWQIEASGAAAGATTFEAKLEPTAPAATGEVQLP